MSVSAPLDGRRLILSVAHESAPGILVWGMLPQALILLLLLAPAIAVLTIGLQRSVTLPLARLRCLAMEGVPSAPGTLPADMQEIGEALCAALQARDVAQQTALRDAGARADILAAEAHHRVKNTLQVISSLLALQAPRITDPKARREFETARDRVRAIATVHRHLYAHHDPEAIDLGPFIEELATQMKGTVVDQPAHGAAPDVTAPALRISTDQAVPLALIVAEIIAAMVTDGAPPAAVRVHVTAEGASVRIVIAADGTQPPLEDRLGAALLAGLVRQIGGALRREAGVTTLDFPLRASPARAPASVCPPARAPASVCLPACALASVCPPASAPASVRPPIRPPAPSSPA